MSAVSATARYCYRAGISLSFASICCALVLQPSSGLALRVAIVTSAAAAFCLVFAANRVTGRRQNPLSVVMSYAALAWLLNTRGGGWGSSGGALFWATWVLVIESAASSLYVCVICEMDMD